MIQRVFATAIGFFRQAGGDELTIRTLVKAISRRAGYPIATAALFLCVAQVPSVHADSASCIAKVSSYVTELDELLSKERNWLTPFVDLNKRYFPLRDCEADALLEVVRRSSFIQSISYNPRSQLYVIHFSSDDVIVGFGYLASEKKSTENGPLWVRK